MTDASLPVTQSRVEKFAQIYLESIGASIDRAEDHWNINIPADAEAGLPQESTVYLGDCDRDLNENEETLNPESGFFKRILEEASERGRGGKIAIDADDADVMLPAWLENGPLDISEADFIPYYDRTAVVVLYEVSIETVSEFEQVVLKATAIDVRSKESLPNLAEYFLDFTDHNFGNQSIDPIVLDDAKLNDLLKKGSQTVAESARWKIDEIHREASQAADQELEDYRRMQEQRIEELGDRHEHLGDRLDELNDHIDHQTENSNRIELLQERQEIRSEYQNTKEKLDQLHKERELGFPSKQREIRERHEVEVVVRPRTVTEISYDRGEIELQIETGSVTDHMRLGYGSGIGVTDSIQCDFCGKQLSEDRPLVSITGGIKCRRCA